METLTPLQTVQKTYQSFGQGDIPTMLALMAPDFEWDSHYPANVPIGGVWKGQEGVVAFLQALGSSMDVKAFDVRGFVAEGDKVVVIGFEDCQAKTTGRDYHNEWVHVWTVQDGKLTSVRTYNDTSVVSAAFG